jgi:two-component system KDP operon response regulator KdpE
MNNLTNVLIVEDESAIRILISTALETNGYNFEMATNGSMALSLLVKHQFDIILLDLGLPDLDGIDIIKKLRTFSFTPIIVISARSNDDDKIRALDMGADDYLTKPFSVEELLARIRSTLRRIQYKENTLNNDDYFVNGHLKIDYIETLKFSDLIKFLPVANFDIKNLKKYISFDENLLCLLSKNIGRVLTHQYILDKVWVNSIESDLSSLRVYITSLRKKIEKISNEKYIQTHVGVGYKMIKIDNSDVEDKNNE